VDIPKIDLDSHWINPGSVGAWAARFSLVWMPCPCWSLGGGGLHSSKHDRPCLYRSRIHPTRIKARHSNLQTWPTDLMGTWLIMSPDLCGYISKTQWVLNHFNVQIMETGSVFEMSVYLSHLSWLWFWEHFIEFCHLQIFKTSVIYPFMTELFWEEVFLRSWYFRSCTRHSLPCTELKVYYVLTRRSEPDRFGSHFYIF